MQISDTMVGLFVSLATWVGIIYIVSPSIATQITFYGMSVISIVVFLVFVVAYTKHVTAQSRERKAKEAADKEAEIAKKYWERFNQLPLPPITDAPLPPPPTPNEPVKTKSKPKKSLDAINDELEG